MKDSKKKKKKETRIKCFKQISAFKQEKLVEIKYK